MIQKVISTEALKAFDAMKSARLPMPGANGLLASAVGCREEKGKGVGVP